MAEQFFNRIADHVLRASDHIQARFEEGWSVVSTGELPESTRTDGGAIADATTNTATNLNLGFDEDMDLEGLTEEELRELLETQNMMEHNPLKGIADDVMGNIIAGNVGPQTPMEHFDAFRSAITWSETFILGLVTFQVVMFLTCLYISRREAPLVPRVCILVLIGVIVRSAEYINGWGAQHWEEFATQDYFDKRGVFVGIMLSGPLLLDSLMMLFMFVSEAGSLLVQVKREELKRTKHKQQQTSKNTANRSKTRKQD